MPELLQEIERLAKRLVVDQRPHVLGVEEGALARSLRLHHRAGDVGDEPIALSVALLGDAGAVDLGSIDLLAVQRLGDLKILVPGLRRLQARFVQDVRPIVEHVEVAIERDEVGLAGVGRGEIPEERRDLVPLEIFVLGDARREFLKIAARCIVDHPLRREHRSIDRVGAARPVGQHLLVEVGERNRDDVDLRAGQLLEFGGATLKWLLDRAGLRHDVHRDAVELSGLCANRRSERKHHACDRRR